MVARERARVNDRVLVLSVPLPPSVNHLYYNTPTGRRMTKEGKAYKRLVAETLMQQRARTKAPDPPYEVSLWLLVPDNRRRDASNMVKAIEDAVADFLMYDDSANHILHLYKAKDRHNPRAILTLEHKTERIPVPPDEIGEIL